MAERVKHPTVGKLLREYPTVKGYSLLAVKMYRGFRIVQIAAGPDNRADLPLYKGMLASRLMPGHDIETKTWPRISQVIRQVDHFWRTEVGQQEGEPTSAVSVGVP